MQNSPVSSASSSSAVNNSSSNHYSPSVPISVYRELAAELSSTQIQMETYKFQNQQLVEQNQKLRLEIERVVQSALYLRQIADGHKGAMPSPVAPPLQVATAAAPQRSPQRVAPETLERLFTEQPEPKPRHSGNRPVREINGWWLTVIIGVVIITAFGTGFLIVRPLLPSR